MQNYSQGEKGKLFQALSFRDNLSDGLTMKNMYDIGVVIYIVPVLPNSTH